MLDFILLFTQVKFSLPKCSKKVTVEKFLCSDLMYIKISNDNMEIEYFNPEKFP